MKYNYLEEKIPRMVEWYTEANRLITLNLISQLDLFFQY